MSRKSYIYTVPSTHTAVPKSDATAPVYYDLTTKNNSTSEFIDDVFLNTSGNQTVLQSTKNYDAALIRFSIPSESVPLLKHYYHALLTASFDSTKPTILTNVQVVASLSIINNLAVGMELIFHPEPYVINDLPITITSVTIDSPTSATITLSRAYTGVTGIHSFSASLFSISTRNVETGEYYTTNVTPPTRPGVNSRTTYGNLINNFNRSLATSFYASNVGLLPAPFFRLDETSNLISLYGSTDPLMDNYPVLLSDQMYQLVTGLPLERTSPNRKQLLISDNPIGSGLNVETITPVPTVYRMTENATTTLTHALLSGFYPYIIIVGSTVSGPGIPAGTTVIDIALNYTTLLQTITISHAATLSGDQNLTFTAPSYTAYKMTQPQSSLYNWSPLKRIILTTSQIPIKRMVVQPPLPLSVVFSGANSSTPNASVSQQILFDYEPPSGKVDYSPYQFSAIGPWRVNRLQGDSELRGIDLQTYWEDYNGNLNLFQIPPTKESSKLIAFINRGT